MKVVKKVFFIALMIWMLYYISSHALTGTVITEGARIRKEASTNSEVVNIAYKDEKVEIIEKKDNWYKVKYKDLEGYIRDDLLKADGEINENQNLEAKKPANNTNEEQAAVENTITEETNNEQETPAEEKQEVKSIEKELTIDCPARIIPSLSASRIFDLTKGTKVMVIKIINNWSCVEYNNKTAWVVNKCLKDIGEVSNVAPPQTTDGEVIKVGYVNVVDGANVREEPNTSSTILTTLSRNNKVEILAEEGSWYKIKLDNHVAYISKALVSDTEVQTTNRSLEQPRQVETNDIVEQPAVSVKTVYVSVAAANIRSSSTTSSGIISKKNRKEAIEVVGEENGWYKINNGGYILKTLTVDNIEAIVEPKKQTEAINIPIGNSYSNSGSGVVEYANQFLGYKYAYGGTGPSSFDCSGFTQYIFKNFGVSLPHSAVSQANCGSPVSKSELQIGDILIFNDWDNSSIGHCGIYVGNSRFIHAANSSRGVVTDTFASGYYAERYVSARRVI